MKKRIFSVVSLFIILGAWAIAYDYYEDYFYQYHLFQPESRTVYLPCFAVPNLCKTDTPQMLLDLGKYRGRRYWNPAVYWWDFDHDIPSRNLSWGIKILNYLKWNYISSFLTEPWEEYLIDIDQDTFLQEQKAQFFLHNQSLEKLSFCLSVYQDRKYLPNRTLPIKIWNQSCNQVNSHQYFSFTLDHPILQKHFQKYRIKLIPLGKKQQQVSVTFRGID